MRIEGQYRFKITNEDLFDKIADKFWEQAPNMMNKIGWRMDYNNSFPILEIEDLTATNEKNQKVVLSKLASCAKDISDVMLEESAQDYQHQKEFQAKATREYQTQPEVSSFINGAEYGYETKEKELSETIAPKYKYKKQFGKYITGCWRNGKWIALEEFDDVVKDGKTGEERAKEWCRAMNLQENRKMKKDKNLLKETSHEFQTPVNVMNYDEGSFTKIVKELFKDYNGFSLDSIQAAGDGEWYNINVTVDVSEEYEELESKRFVLSQKIHKLKSEFFAELSQYVPVVNSTIGAVSFTKLEDKAKFVITVLLSKTNVRNWVTGKRPEKVDLKDLNKNILDILNGK